MYKLLVLTNPETAHGFRLAGVEVHEAASSDEARKKLGDFLNDDRSGIIAIDEDLMAHIGERLKNKIDRIYRPIVVPIPAKKKIIIGEERAEYIRSLIRRAVGFDIKLGG
ncbi:MAG: V-type ATP synthase subunit F [Actinobacteria bacterium]|nr:MAG: V-type ATP synthase subunit F [Actinomycetota bacterium]